MTEDDTPRRRPYAILDRDGTLIVERNYLTDPDGVELIEGVPEALRTLEALGVVPVVVTNQSAVGRGYMDLDRLAQIHGRMEALLEAEGVGVAGIYACPHHPDAACACRKPGTALVEQAARDLDFDLSSPGFVIGDAPVDLELGRALGATRILVRSGHGSATEARGDVPWDQVFDDLLSAVAWMEGVLDDSR